MKIRFLGEVMQKVFLTAGLACLSSAVSAADNDRPAGLNGYYSGTPLGAATADPYGQNHYYVPGYALSPGLRSYQSGTGAPIYGQPYAPGEMLNLRRRPDDRMQPLGNENAKPEDDISR
jgi:hypothetical protein